MARGKVITTHLLNGDPNGIRTVFISNKICEMIVFPKAEFDEVKQDGRKCASCTLYPVR